MIQRLSSGLNKLKKYGEAIKGRLRPCHYQEPIETDISEYPRTPDEAAEILKNLRLEDKKPNFSYVPPVNDFFSESPYFTRKSRKSRIARIVERAIVSGEGISNEDLGKVSRGQNDPISTWRFIRDIEEN